MSNNNNSNELDFSKISVGTVFKNYKALCDTLGLKVKGGNTKIAQMKDIARYMLLEQQNYSFTVKEVYSEPKPKVNNKGKTTKEFFNFKVPLEFWELKGIYKITLNNDIYIGSTISGFRNRFIKHHDKSNKLVTKEMLKDGAIFQIIEICEGMTEKEIRDLENDYITMYKNNSNWNVFNANGAWSFTEPKKKVKKLKSKKRYKTIKVEKSKYKEAINILKSNGLV